MHSASYLTGIVQWVLLWLLTVTNDILEHFGVLELHFVKVSPRMTPLYSLCFNPLAYLLREFRVGLSAKKYVRLTSLHIRPKDSISLSLLMAPRASH